MGRMKSKIGQYRHEIEFFERANVKDANDQLDETFSTLGTARAKRIVMSGNERLNGERYERPVTHRFELRYNAAFKDADKIVFDGEDYRIETFKNPDSLKREMLFMTELGSDE